MRIRPYVSLSFLISQNHIVKTASRKDDWTDKHNLRPIVFPSRRARQRRAPNGSRRGCRFRSGWQNGKSLRPLRETNMVRLRRKRQEVERPRGVALTTAPSPPPASFTKYLNLPNHPHETLNRLRPKPGGHSCADCAQKRTNDKQILAMLDFPCYRSSQIANRPNG
jgi:hypothetical protein